MKKNRIADETDIVRITSLNLEGMVMAKGYDIDTKEYKFSVICEDRKLYFVKSNDIIVIDNFENRLEENLLSSKVNLA